MRIVLLAIALMTLGSVTCSAQDPLAEHKVRALKDLVSLAVVLRPNTPREVLPFKDWGDMMDVGLARNIPSLKVTESATEAPAWLELSVVTADRGGFLRLTLYRWVAVQDSSEVIFAPVWTDMQAQFGHLSRTSLQESLDSLLTRFAADYLRANRRAGQPAPEPASPGNRQRK